MLLLRTTQGNVAFIFAVAVFPLLFMVLSALDFSRQISATNKLQAAVDGAALAAASLIHNEDPETVARDWMDSSTALMNVTAPEIEISVTEAINSREVKVTATYKLAGYAPQFGSEAKLMPIKVSSTAYEEAFNIEVAMVLDISSSMKGSRIAELREATKSFLELILDGELLERTSVTLVPYGGTVNMSKYFGPIVGSTLPWNGCYDETEDNQDDIAFNTIEATHTANFWKWNVSNPWCPKNSSRMLANSNNLDVLKAEVDAWELSDGTGSDIGTMWGVRSLDPSWQGVLQEDFPNRPSSFTEASTLKFLIVMTDGGITAQFRPNIVDETYESIQGGQNQVTFYNKSSASGIFTDACDYAKANGVRIFSIAYQVRNNSQKNLLQDCSGEADYFEAGSDNLESTFAQIASRMSELRVTD